MSKMNLCMFASDSNMIDATFLIFPTHIHHPLIFPVKITKIYFFRHKFRKKNCLKRQLTKDFIQKMVKDDKKVLSLKAQNQAKSLCATVKHDKQKVLS